MIDKRRRRVTKPKKQYEHGDLEFPIEREILIWLHSRRIMAWKVKTVGTYDPKIKNFRKTQWYYRKGVWDIHGFYRRRPFIIEVKSRKGELTDLQIEFESDYRQNAPRDAIIIVARSLDDVQKAFGQIDRPYAA